MSEDPKPTGKPADETGEKPAEGKKKDPAAKWTKRILILCILFFIWYVIGDRYTPYTGQARVRGFVVPIVPEVSGVLTEVNVGLNERVEQGHVLARISAKDYELAVANAEAALEQAGQQAGASTAEVARATAALAEAKAQYEIDKRQGERVLKAARAGAVSKTDMDRAESMIERGKAQVKTAEAKLEQAKQQLGGEGSDNSGIRAAQAALEDAQLDLKRTVLRAPSDGGVTNVRVDAGQYAAAGQPLMTFISVRTVWVEAYMRENSIGRVKEGDTVSLVLDSTPGRVFEGKVESVGFGVDWGDVDNAGNLPKISAPRDWLRDPQRFPVIISIDRENARGKLREGGQADVVIYTSKNPLFNLIGKGWIRLVSWFSYVR